jgi:DNA (cytosine-5)-methyltransferase 3A
MNVLSLFDGMSCGQQALERAGFKIDNYFASEIDKYAIQVTMANYPNTKQIGSVVNVDGYSLPKIDLLIGGSPCQSFSFAGKRKGMSTKDEQEILTLEHYLQLKAEGFEFEGQSYLFWEYMRLLNETKPKYFLLENVMMGEKWEKVLSKAIGVKPIMINSALISAQNRQRLYWTNIGLAPAGLFGDLETTIEQPKDKGILLKDILELEVDSKYFLSEKAMKYVTDETRMKKRFTQDASISDKSLTHCAKNQSNLCGDFVTVNKDFIVAMRGRNPDNPKSRESGLPTVQMLESRTDGKTNCLTTVQKDNLVIMGGDFRSDEGYRWRSGGKSGTLMAQARTDGTAGQALVKIEEVEIIATQLGNSESFGNSTSEKGKAFTLRKCEPNGVIIDSKIRRLTPIECERLQTVRDNYTNHVSDSQRYKMLGNGWTVDVITHFFKYMK